MRLPALLHKLFRLVFSIWRFLPHKMWKQSWEILKSICVIFRFVLTGLLLNWNSSEIKTLRRDVSDVGTRRNVWIAPPVVCKIVDFPIYTKHFKLLVICTYKKQYDFDGNQNRSALSKKEQPKTTEKTHENLNRSNTYSFWANNLVLFSWTGLYCIFWREKRQQYEMQLAIETDTTNYWVLLKKTRQSSSFDPPAQTNRGICWHLQRNDRHNLLHICK